MIRFICAKHEHNFEGALLSFAIYFIVGGEGKLCSSNLQSPDWIVFRKSSLEPQFSPSLRNG